MPNSAMTECETEANRAEIHSEESFHEESVGHSKYNNTNGNNSIDETSNFRPNRSQSFDGGASGQRGQNDGSLSEENASYIMLDYGQQISIKDNVIEIHAVDGENGETNGQQYASENQLKNEFDSMSTDGSIQAQPCDSYSTDAARRLHYPEDQEEGERMPNSEESKVSDDNLPHIMSFSAPPEGSAEMEQSAYCSNAGTSSTSSNSPSYAVQQSCQTPGMPQNYDCNFRRPPAPMSTPSDGQYPGDGHRVLRAPSYPRMPHVRTPHPMHMMYMPPGSRNMMPPQSTYYQGPGPVGHFQGGQGYPGMQMMGDGLNSSGEDQHSSPEYPSVPNNTPSSMIEGTPHRPIIGPLDNKAPLFVPQLHSICTSVAAARQHHNAKERMRRARVKDACQLLRELVPGMTDKTDKATVFEFGTQYILFLKERIGKKYDREFLQKYSPY